MRRSQRKAVWGVGLGLVLATTAVGLAVGQRPSEPAGAGSESEVRIGIRISPVPLSLVGRNRALVGKGSYLVNAVGSCNDCHTCPSFAPGHNPYFGGDGQINAENYLAGGLRFGPFVSRNLTPAPNGLPAGRTLDEFMQILRTGHEPGNPDAVLQVMPWPVLRNMTDHDLAAIYEFLSAIPPAPPGNACSGPGE